MPVSECRPTSPCIRRFVISSSSDTSATPPDGTSDTHHSQWHIKINPPVQLPRLATIPPLHPLHIREHSHNNLINETTNISRQCCVHPLRPQPFCCL